MLTSLLRRSATSAISLLLCSTLAIAACSSDETETNGSATSTTTTGGGMGGIGSGGMGGSGGTLPFELTSTSYMEGGTIPLTNECGTPNGPGDNVSPPLSWTPGPPGTLSYAVVMHDLDFQNLVHWVIYDIAPATLALPAGIPAQYQPTDPAGSKQASIQGVFFGYLGPCSPNSINTYELTVHAMPVDTLQGVDMNTSDTALATQVEGMSIASASLSGES
jgi:Raf kinase inhibitor-like YbhB/YbcL family protein